VVYLCQVVIIIEEGERATVGDAEWEKKTGHQGAARHWIRRERRAVAVGVGFEEGVCGRVFRRWCCALGYGAAGYGGFGGEPTKPSGFLSRIEPWRRPVARPYLPKQAPEQLVRLLSTRTSADELPGGLSRTLNRAGGDFQEAWGTIGYGCWAGRALCVTRGRGRWRWRGLAGVVRVKEIDGSPSGTG
jgi:hypothetical protein